MACTATYAACTWGCSSKTKGCACGVPDTRGERGSGRDGHNEGARDDTGTNEEELTGTFTTSSIPASSSRLFESPASIKAQL